MPLYEADGKKQKPIVNLKHSMADCPTEEVISKRPSHVTVNKVGIYAFLYHTTSSLGTAPDYKIETYTTGSVVQNAAAGGMRVEINPVAWRRTDAVEVVGDVTFVYVRVR